MVGTEPCDQSQALFFLHGSTATSIESEFVFEYKSDKRLSGFSYTENNDRHTDYKMYALIT